MEPSDLPSQISFSWNRQHLAKTRGYEPINWSPDGSKLMSSDSVTPPGRTRFKTRLLLILPMLFGSTAIAVRLVALISYCAMNSHGKDRSPAWIGCTIADLAILIATFLTYGSSCLRLWRAHYKRHRTLVRHPKDSVDVDREALLEEKAEAKRNSHQEQMNNSSGSHVHRTVSLFWGRVLRSILVICNLFLFASTIVLVAYNSSALLAEGSKADVRSVVTVTFESVGAAFTSLFFVMHVVHESFPVAMIAQSVVIMASTLEVVIAIVSVWINSTGKLVGVARNSLDKADIVDQVIFNSKGFPYYGVVIAAVGAVGLVIGSSLNAYNRLSDVATNLAYFYIFASGASEIVCMVYFAFSCANVRTTLDLGSFRDVVIADPVLSFSAMVLNIVGMVAMIKLRERPRSSLKVETYDLTKLTPNQLAAWAALIDTYSQLLPGATAGKEALSLMLAYVKSPTKNMHCKVLRVYDDSNLDDLNNENSSHNLHNHVPKHYETVRAWEQLDKPAIFDDAETTQADVATVVSQNVHSVDAQQPMSKKARKKLEKKATKKAEKRISQNLSMKAPTVEAQIKQYSDQDLRNDTEFRNVLMTTEALVLLTVVEDYDLTSPLGEDTWYGKLLARTVGKDSFFKICCVRMGLLATHFPFRQCTLYTSPTKKPNARAAAVCLAVAQYNSDLPRSERCDLILNPAFAHKGQGEAFKPSGWITVPLPPSHVVDLRQYKGKTLKDYLKAIKYRNQAVAFNRAEGVVIETKDFSYENCSIAMNLWSKIASKRTSDGHTAVLSPPTVDFLRSLGNTCNQDGYRTMLFLKVDDEVIASCVLFRLGKTITSDIQGLNHEVARQYKAYFVMMQETIAIALKEGIDFVDFGPTTAKPKMDIGSKEVNLVGGMYARQPLAAVISLFAGQVDS